MERAYTVGEIDELRHVLETRYIWGTTAPTGNCMSQGFYEKDKVVAVEEQLRTAMLAGHTAKDIIEADRQ